MTPHPHPTAAYFVANTVGYTGVATVGSPANNYGDSTAPTSGSITVTAGQVAYCALGFGDASLAASASSPTGGTNPLLSR